MPKENLVTQLPEIKESLPQKTNPKSALKIILFILLITLAASGLIYAGYWYGTSLKQPEITPLNKFRAPTGNLPESSEGDEFTETDPGWKEAVDKTTEEYKKTQMLYYKNDDYKFAFYYPTGIFVEKNPRPLQEGPIIFLDTKLIDVPEVYGGPLTPVEISIRTKTLTQELDSFKNGGYTDPLAYREKELPPNLKAKGVWATSIMKGFMEGSGIETVLLKGSKGLIDISYYPNESFSSKDFEQILNTFELF